MSHAPNCHYSKPPDQVGDQDFWPCSCGASKTHAAEDRATQAINLLWATRNELAILLETLTATQQQFDALRDTIRSQTAELDRVEAERDELKRQLAALRIERGAA